MHVPGSFIHNSLKLKTTKCLQHQVDGYSATRTLPSKEGNNLIHATPRMNLERTRCLVKKTKFISIYCITFMWNSRKGKASPLVAKIETVVAEGQNGVRGFWLWGLLLLLLSHFSRVQLCATPWTRLLHPWDFPGKSTGVGCHCLLRTVKATISKLPGMVGMLGFLCGSEGIHWTGLTASHLTTKKPPGQRPHLP